MSNLSNKTLQYKPTTVERRILETCTNPIMLGAKIETRIADAKTCRDTWYKAFNKPEFVALLNVMSVDILKGKINDVVNATFKFATTDSKCGSDRKLLLTMSGIYSEKNEMKNEIDSNITITMSKELESWSH